MPAFTDHVEKTELYTEVRWSCPWDALEAKRTHQKEEGSPRFPPLGAGREDDWTECQIWPPGGDVWARSSSPGGEVGAAGTSCWLSPTGDMEQQRPRVRPAPGSTGSQEGRASSEIRMPPPAPRPSPGNSWPEGNMTPAGHAIPPDRVMTLWPSQDSLGGEKAWSPALTLEVGVNPVRTEGGGSHKVGALGCLGRTLGSRPGL